MIRLFNLVGEPVGRNRTLADEKAIKRSRQLRVGGGRDLAIVRDLADVPQPLYRLRPCRKSADVIVARGMLQHQDVLGERRARRTRVLWSFRKRSLQGADRGKVKLGIAPLQHLDWLE